MEKQLKCFSLLSLKEMALRKMVVHLWSDPDILSSISKLNHLFFHEQKDQQEAIHNKVKDEVLKLELPHSLSEKMIDIVRPVGEEIRRWREAHKGVFIYSPDLSKLCWTTAGTIHRRQTAEELLRCNVMCERYEIACYYCLEDYIPLTWEELPDKEKGIFSNNKNICHNLQFCWAHILKGEHSTLNYLTRTSDENPITLHQYAFEHSAERGNKEATVYFLNKLTHDEREASLMKTAFAVVKNPNMWCYQDETLSDVLRYLLSVMSPEQQTHILKDHAIEVLLSFFDWRQKDFLLENADLIWTFIPPIDYDKLIFKLGKILTHSDPYSPKLFQEFFIKSLPEFKKYFVDVKPESNNVLSVIFEFNDPETMQVIFRNVDAEERVRLVFHPAVFRLFYKSMFMRKWDVVEVCLREAALSRQDRDRLREVFLIFLNSRDIGPVKSGSQKWKRFFEFLEETDASANQQKKTTKRKL